MDFIKNLPAKVDAFYKTDTAKWVGRGLLGGIFVVAPLWASVPVGAFFIVKWVVEQDDK